MIAYYFADLLRHRPQAWTMIDWHPWQNLSKAAAMVSVPASTSHTPVTQAYVNFGWEENFRPWGNMTEPGSTFSPSGHRLATVIWVHYISKASITSYFLEPFSLPRGCESSI